MSFEMGMEYADRVSNRSNVLRLPNGITDSTSFLKGFLYKRTFVHSAGKPTAKNPVKVTVQFNARKVDGMLVTAVNRWFNSLGLDSINPAPLSLEKKGEWIIAIVKPDHISKVVNSLCGGMPDAEEKKRALMERIEEKKRELIEGRSQERVVEEPKVESNKGFTVEFGGNMKLYPIYTEDGKLKGYVERAS